MKWYMFCGFCLCTCTCAGVVILLLSSDSWYQTNPSPSKTSKGRDVTTLHRTVGPPTGQSTCCELMSGFSLEKLCLHRNGSTQPLELENLNCNCTDLLYCRLVVMTALDSDHYKEAVDMIASVHTFLPNTKIILYELAMKENFCPPFAMLSFEVFNLISTLLTQGIHIRMHLNHCQFGKSVMRMKWSCGWMLAYEYANHLWIICQSCLTFHFWLD